LLFIFLETAPILSKLFAPIGPYDHLLQGKEYPYKMAYFGQIQESKSPPDPSLKRAKEVNASHNKNQEKLKLQSKIQPTVPVLVFQLAVLETLLLTHRFPRFLSKQPMLM
jgi:hypothetical protein